MYPTAEQIRIAVQGEIQMTGLPLVAVVSESSHGINGPTYHVAFQPAEESKEAQAVPA